MRRTSFWKALLITASLSVIALAPGAARAQLPSDLRGDLAPVFRGQIDGALPDPNIPLPLGHDRYEEGGFFVHFDWVMYHQTNPLTAQLLAVRGFVDSTGRVTGSQGQFVGSRASALDTTQLGGPGTYTPGWKVAFGWRFRDGSAVEFDWTQMFNTHYNHTATFVPPTNQFGEDLSSSFLSAPVFNFPNQYAGPAEKVRLRGANPGGLGDTFAVYGIWNGASIMSIDFIQRYSQGDIAYREPILETDDYKLYGLAGARFAWIWERFRWRTVSENLLGEAGPTDVGIYTNIVSNRMYGGFVGCGQDWWLGHGFSVNLDLKAALLLDIVKERAEYALGVKDLPPISKRSLTDYTVVPQLQGTLSVSYNPVEAIQFRVGYDVMAFFNTKASSHPVTFDWGGIDPAFNHEFIRFFDGWQASFGFVF